MCARFPRFSYGATAIELCPSNPASVCAVVLIRSNSRFFLAPVIWWLLRRLHGSAAVNLATSSSTCDELRAQGIDRVQLWPRGVDLDLFAPRPADRPAADRPPVALYVGRLAAE